MTNQSSRAELKSRTYDALAGLSARGSMSGESRMVLSMGDTLTDHGRYLMKEAVDFGLFALFPTIMPSLLGEGMFMGILAEIVGEGREFRWGRVAFHQGEVVLWVYELDRDNFSSLPPHDELITDLRQRKGTQLIESFTDVTLDDLMAVIPFEQRSVTVYGNTYPQPRLTKWYGPVPYTYSNLTWEPAEMPPLIESLRQEIEEVTGCQFNTVLANLYRNGEDNIGWHSDDEPLFGDRPVIASLSFGATRTFKLRRKIDHKDQQSFELTDGSLLIMYDDVQVVWQHSLPKRKRVSEPRINLTFRLAQESS